MKKKVRFDDVEDFFRKGIEEVKGEMKKVGYKAVSYAKATGDYEDHTGHLRASNDFYVDEHGLKVFNTAEYASYVESKGYNVVTAAALFAEEQLKKTFES